MRHVRHYHAQGAEKDALGLFFDRHTAGAMDRLIADHGAFEPKTGEGAAIFGEHCRHYHIAGAQVDIVGRHYDEHPRADHEKLCTEHGVFDNIKGVGVCCNTGDHTHAAAKKIKEGIKERHRIKLMSEPLQVLRYHVLGGIECPVEIARANPICRYDVAFQVTPAAANEAALIAAHDELRAEWDQAYSILARTAGGAGYQLRIPNAVGAVVGAASERARRAAETKQAAKVRRMSALIGAAHAGVAGRKDELLTERNELAASAGAAKASASSRTAAELRTEIAELRAAELATLRTELKV